MNPQDFHTPADLCPKRGWVLSVLTDDEDVDASLPQGVRFHLRRCPSCREAADRVRSAVERLRAFTEREYEPSLLDRADDQAFAALRAGAAPSVVVISPESESVDDVLLDDENRRRRRWSWTNRVAAIAALLTFAVFLIEAWREGDRQALVRHRIQPLEARDASGAPGVPDPLNPAVLVGGGEETPGHHHTTDNNAATPVLKPQGDVQPAFGSPRTGHAIHKRDE